MIDRLFERQSRSVAQCCALMAFVCICRVVVASPWQLLIPSTNEQARQGLVCYPVGAVEYLRTAEFRGNLMLPFEVGGYAMWKLAPLAKVSIDGRYEVAYQDGVLEEHLLLFAAKPGWQNVLTKYPTDAVLVPSLSRLAKVMPSLDDWNRVYEDGVYEIYTRPGFSLPPALLNCATAHASMPYVYSLNESSVAGNQDSTCLEPVGPNLLTLEFVFRRSGAWCDCRTSSIW